MYRFNVDQILNTIFFKYIFYQIYLKKSLKISFKYKKYIKTFKKYFLQYINMENTNNINNEKVKPKRVYTKAQQKASKVYHEKIKIMKNTNKETEIKQKEHMKKIKNILQQE